MKKMFYQVPECGMWVCRVEAGYSLSAEDTTEPNLNTNDDKSLEGFGVESW